MTLRIGTAGWAIPRAAADRFDPEGTHLARYARVLRGVEINSCFYRPHLRATYERWRQSTPDDFRFAVKLPRSITHEQQLRDARDPLVGFLAQTDGLAEKRGPILVQLPPSLAFDVAVVTPFLDLMREMYGGPLVCEPRHPSWFVPAVEGLLAQYHVSRVAADPPPVPCASVPAAFKGLVYFRLHGSPRTYWSRYDAAYIAALAQTLHRTQADDVWCVFDNTAAGAAIENALETKCRIVK